MEESYHLSESWESSLTIASNPASHKYISWKASDDSSVTGVITTTWETWIKSAFGLFNLFSCKHLEDKSVTKKILSHANVCICISLPFQSNKHNFKNITVTGASAVAQGLMGHLLALAAHLSVSLYSGCSIFKPAICSWPGRATEHGYSPGACTHM